MKKQDFDKRVQELIAGLKEDYDPKSWDSFEKKLQFEEEMDELIKSSMESYEEPFNEKHWELLTEEIHRRKVRSIIKRVSEVIIILLLLMTAHNFIQYKGDNNQGRKHIDLIALNADYPQLINHIDLSQDPSFYQAIENSELKTSIVTNQKTTKGLIEESNDQTISLGDSRDFYKESKVITGQPILISPNNEINEYSTTPYIATLALNNLNIENDKLRSPSQDIALAQNEPTNGFWVGLVAGPDVNFVNSPFDLNLLKNPIQSQSGSMTIGATLSKDIGLFEISTGLLYSNKNYFPNRIREFVPSINQKYLETSLRSLEFEQIKIPLMVNLHTPRSSGWSMYGTIGIGANIITKTQYDIETQVRSFSAAPSSSSGVEDLNLRELPRGAFQSGTFGNNVYLSAMAGFGIEKRINNKLGFSLLTTYQRSLSKEINPVINRTQQLSMSLGIKLNLN